MHSLMFARNMTRDYGTELESRVFKMSAALVLLLLVRGISAATIRYVEHTHWTPKNPYSAFHPHSSAYQCIPRVVISPRCPRSREPRDRLND